MLYQKNGLGNASCRCQREQPPGKEVGSLAKMGCGIPSQARERANALDTQIAIDGSLTFAKQMKCSSTLLDMFGMVW